MNWGKGIIIGMAIFMAFILAMGVRMFNNPTDDYDHDYYEKGLRFDADYRKEKQVTLDDAKPKITLTASAIDIKFKTAATGQIHFMRPADRRLDRQLQFKSDATGAYNASLGLPASGRWQVQLNWQSNGKQYLYQQEVWVP
ncbi:nitrogen fixation protein FixH [Mucilaginibacter yixingensis]|uniref:Nitrogen fixation protein FixH n=1 Tax=Mucilaginibacter yixingensis TaxID=1295612 RepID=A0A2T5JBH8_9SPHI|nr:FixH family protein [Mucilaginibacter yixingensis]PTQ98220.1 nitrogen fixation protein FixH [Mucilaginibacter yixingensis]